MTEITFIVISELFKKISQLRLSKLINGFLIFEIFVLQNKFFLSHKSFLFSLTRNFIKFVVDIQEFLDILSSFCTRMKFEISFCYQLLFPTHEHLHPHFATLVCQTQSYTEFVSRFRVLDKKIYGFLAGYKTYLP